MSVEYEEKCDEIIDEIRDMIGFGDESADVPEPSMAQRHIEINLNGPKSPLESRLYSSFRYSQLQSIDIEPNSVNSILLDASLQNTFEKILVAGNVTRNQKGTTLTVRETSTMPNIPGFGPLMALIFSPYCEFFRDQKKTRFTTIICGLGENPNTKDPLFAEHDIVFNLDTELDTSDVENINKIRFSIDTLLQMAPDQNRTKVTGHEQNTLTITIKEAIVAANDIYGTNAVFPLHNILTLAAENSAERLKEVQFLIANNEQLHNMASMNTPVRRPVKCLLCNLDLESSHELKIHLFARLHLDREKRISFQHKSAKQ